MELISKKVLPTPFAWRRKYLSLLLFALLKALAGKDLD